MEIMVENYGAFMTHLESLAITDSQALKKAEIEGFAKWWKQASYIINAAIYPDVLSPIKRLSLAMQQERHDPVKTVRHVQEFTWTMAKLKILIDESLDGEGSVMTRYKRLMSLIEQSEDGMWTYRGILQRYRWSHYSKHGETLCRFGYLACVSVPSPVVRYCDMARG